MQLLRAPRIGYNKYITGHRAEVSGDRFPWRYFTRRETRGGAYYKEPEPERREEARGGRAPSRPWWVHSRFASSLGVAVGTFFGSGGTSVSEDVEEFGDMVPHKGILATQKAKSTARMLAREISEVPRPQSALR